MTQPNEPSENPTVENPVADARDQAAEYKSVFAPSTLTFDDDTTMSIPPHPNMRLLDDDRLADYDELLLESESYLRGPDTVIPEQEVKDKHGNVVTTLPPTTRPGPLLFPYRTKDGLVKPPFEVKQVIAALGQADYEKLRTKTIDGLRAGAQNVWAIWNQQGVDLKERQASDTKSDGSTGDLADAAPPDSE